MIFYVKGSLMAIEEDVIVTETGHMGLTIYVLTSLFPGLPGMGKGITVYTYFQIREGTTTLYGLLHNQDGDMFRQLPGINGVGPKGALGILFVLRPDDLRLVIVSKDVKALTKVPDIGNKTMQCLIPNLKDKISMNDVPGDIAGGAGMGAAGAGASMAGLVEMAKEAVQALVVLGYINAEASRAVK